MNKKLFSFVAGSMLLLLSNQAFALTLNGNAVGNVKISSGSVEAQGNVSAQTQHALNATGTANASAGVSTVVDDQGNALNIQLNGGGLAAQASAGSIDQSSEAAIVDLKGNTDVLIKTDADLSTYNSFVLKARPAITAVNVQSDNTVTVDYAQPARFLGIFSASLPGQVDVDAQGNATVQLPWWSIFFAKDTSKVQSSVATSIQQTGVQLNAQADAEAKVQNSARIVNAVTAAIETEAEASANASASTQ